MVFGALKQYRKLRLINDQQAADIAVATEAMVYCPFPGPARLLLPGFRLAAAV